MDILEPLVLGSTYFVATSRSIPMTVMMHFDPRTNAHQSVDTQEDPPETLLRRFTIWEKRIENLIDFFTKVEEFQKVQSRHCLLLSELAGKGLRFGGNDDFPEDGVNTIWTGLKEGMVGLSKFYSGVGESYEDAILKDLRIKLNEIRLFNGELSRLRTTKRLEVAKREKKFMDAVRDLNVSLNRISVPSAQDDPFVENRSINS